MTFHRVEGTNLPKFAKASTGADKVKFGLLFRLGSAWVGVHYSPHNRRYCINLIPFVTFWITLKGGKTP